MAPQPGRTQRRAAKGGVRAVSGAVWRLGPAPFLIKPAGLGAVAAVFRIAEGATFSQAETAAILEGVPKEALPPEADQKLEALDLTEYLEVLGRNLRVLMDKVA